MLKNKKRILQKKGIFIYLLPYLSNDPRILCIYLRSALDTILRIVAGHPFLAGNAFLNRNNLLGHFCNFSLYQLTKLCLIAYNIAVIQIIKFM